MAICHSVRCYWIKHVTYSAIYWINTLTWQHVSGKLPNYPSLKSTLTLTTHLTFLGNCPPSLRLVLILTLGRGRWGVSQKAISNDPQWSAITTLLKITQPFFVSYHPREERDVARQVCLRRTLKSWQYCCHKRRKHSGTFFQTMQKRTSCFPFSKNFFSGYVFHVHLTVVRNSEPKILDLILDCTPTTRILF